MKIINCKCSCSGKRLCGPYVKAITALRPQRYCFSAKRTTFSVFFRLLAEKHRFPNRRAEGQKGPALLLLQWNTRARQFTYISLVAKEMLHKERIFILAARLTRHRVVRTHIKGVAQCVRRDCGHRQCWYKQLYRALAIIVIAEDS